MFLDNELLCKAVLFSAFDMDSMWVGIDPEVDPYLFGGSQFAVVYYVI